MSECREEQINIKNMPQAHQRDFSIDHITNRVISEIIALSEVGTDFREVSVQVAKEILNRFEKEVKDIKNEWVERKDKIKDLANAIVNGNHFTNDIEGHLKELAKEIINICEEL